MDNLETQATLGIQDTGGRQKTTQKANKMRNTDPAKISN